MKKVAVKLQSTNGGGSVPADTIRQILGRPVDFGRDLPYAQVTSVVNNGSVSRCVFFPNGDLFLSSELNVTTDVILAILTLPA